MQNILEGCCQIRRNVMKFRFKLIALVMLMAIAVSAILCACNTDASLLKRNDERYSKQITATATYGDRVSVVDLNELYTSFYRYYSYIYQYYTAGYISAEQFQQYMSNLDQTFADSNESLARNALYVLRNVNELYNLGLKNTDPAKAAKVQAMRDASTANKSYDFSDVKQLEQYYVDRSNEIKAILDVVSADYSYINAAIYYANQQMQTLFDDYVDEVRSEFDALTQDEDTTPEGFTNIVIVSEPNKLVYEVDSKATISLVGMKVVAKYDDAEDVVIPNKYLSISGFDASKAATSQEITVTYGTYSKTFTIDIVAALTDRTKDAEAEETDSEKIAGLTENNTKILDAFVFEINENDYIKDGLTDEEYKDASRELKIARTAMKRTIDSIEKNFRSYNYYLYVGYNNQVNNAYTQKVSDSIRISYQEVLDKYNELVEKALSSYATEDYSKSTLENTPFETIVHKNYGEKAFGYYYVSHVLFKFDDETQAKIDEFKNEKVANDEVIAEFAKSLINQITVWESNPDFDKTATCDKEDCDCPRCSKYTGESVKFDTLKKWFGLDETVENDPCVKFENGERIVTCECDACPVKKYTRVVKAMDVVSEMETALAACGDDLAKKNEVMLDYIYKYNMDPGMFTNLGKDLDYLMTPEDIDSGMVKDYEEKCEELVTAGVGSYGWVASSDYGVFFIMVTGKVADVNDENVTAIEGTDYVKLGLNYVTNAKAELESGEKPTVYDGETEITFEAGSIGYYIWQDLYAEAQSIELKKARDAFFNQYAESGLEYFPKAYKDLIKNIKNGNA